MPTRRKASLSDHRWGCQTRPMQYRPLGRTGIQVSELAFGAMTFGTGMGPVARVDQDGADQLVGRALDAGVNLFDTANSYANGDSERMLGRALTGRRDDVLIATKVGFGPKGPNRSGLAYRTVVESCEASLRRLGTDRIDLFQTHRPDAATPFEETARALDDLVRRGLVRYVGFCNLSGWKAALAVSHQRANDRAEFVSAQMYWSLVGRGIERDLVPCADELGVGILAWSPLAAGYLTAKYVDGGAEAEGRRQTMSFPPVDPATGPAVLDRLRTVAAAHEASPAQVALAWLLRQPGLTSVIVGASNLDHLDDNLAATWLELTDDEVAALDDASAPSVHAPYWWPEIFEAKDYSRSLLNRSP